MSSPDSLGVPSRDEAEELERKRAAWEAMSDEERQAYNKKIDQETAMRNAQRDAERQRGNSEHQEKYVGKKALVVANITVQYGVEIIPIAEKGEYVDIIDADTLTHGWLNDVKIRTTTGKEEWVDSMCLRLQE